MVDLGALIFAEIPKIFSFACTDERRSANWRGENERAVLEMAKLIIARSKSMNWLPRASRRALNFSEQSNCRRISIRVDSHLTIYQCNVEVIT